MSHRADMGDSTESLSDSDETVSDTESSALSDSEGSSSHDEAKTNPDQTSASRTTTSQDAIEREEEMSYDSMGANLNVDDNIKELFKYVGRYKPKTIELDSHLKPFLPEYLPSIGELDPFLKVGRPDQQRDILGIEKLDEPASSQTDAQILIMQLRAQNKTSFKREDEMVRSIQNASKNPTTIDKWISSVSQLHEQKPLPEVQYSKTMPSIDNLMQVWPEEFEQALLMDSNPTFLPADLDLPLQDFATAACALVDIPVYDNHLIHSVHQLFTLWSTFRDNEHFKVLAQQMEECSGTDYRPSTAAAIEAVSQSMGARPSTAQAIQAAMEESMRDYRPDTASGVNSITGNYRPDTASAIAAVMAAQERDSSMGRPDTAAALAAVAAMEANEGGNSGNTK